MLNNIIKFLILILVSSFVIMIFNYYFSEKYLKKINFNRNNLEMKILSEISDLPVLQNDTNNIIKFNSGFDNSNNQKSKRNFWELFK